jgi:hypothetical protein
VTFLEKFVKTVKSKCEIIFNRFGSFGDVVSNNKILYAIPFFANWAFLIALEALKSSLRSYFNLASRAIREAQFTQNLVAQITIIIRFIKKRLHEWCVHNRLFNAYYKVKFKENNRYTY